MIDYLSNSYFTALLNFSTAIAFFFYLIKSKSNFPLKWLFVAYSFVSILQSVFTVIVEVYNPFNLRNTNIPEILIQIFILSEILLFSIFYYFNISTKFFKLIILNAAFLLITYNCYLWISNGRYNNNFREITVIQTFCCIVFSLFFFYETLRTPTTQKLETNPKFWISTGIFLLCSFLFPLFLFFNQLLKLLPSIFFGIYSLNNIAYSILFICLIKAISCQIKLTK